MSDTLSYDEAAAAAVSGSDGTAGDSSSGTLEQPSIDNGASSAAQAWDGSPFAIKFRDREVIPQSQDQLKTWASQGYGYSQRVAELKTREEQINQLESDLGQYRKLAEAFDANPDFKQKIMKLYQDTVSGLATAQASGDQQGIQDNSAILQQVQQMLGPIQQKAAQFDQFQEQLSIQRADEELSKEQEALKGKHKDHDWVTEDEGGHTLMWRILKTAYDKGLTNIEDAYRLYMFDNVAEKSRADALREQAQRIQDEKSRGIVSNGHVIPRSSGPNIANMNWNQVAEAAISEMRG